MEKKADYSKASLVLALLIALAQLTLCIQFKLKGSCLYLLLSVIKVEASFQDHNRMGTLSCSL
jgi:hypothetical protein